MTRYIGKHKIEPEEKDPLVRAEQNDALDGIFVIVDDVWRAFDGWCLRTGSGWGIKLMKYIGEDESVILPEIFEDSEHGAFDESRNLRQVMLPASMREIPEGMFAESCVQSVVIPVGVIKICEQAFYRSGLRDIIIPDSVTSLEELALADCEMLSDVKFSKSLKEIPDSLFENCVSLKTITIPEGVTTIGNCTFSCCWGLQAVDIPDSVISIHRYAFDDCHGLNEETREHIRRINPDVVFDWY